MRKPAVALLLLLCLSALAGAAPIASNQALVLMNGLALWRESGGALTVLEYLVIGDTVTLLNRAGTFVQDGQKKDFSFGRAPDGKEGWVRTPFLAARARPAVVKADKAAIYTEPRDVKLTSRSISNMTFVAVLDEGSTDAFARVRGYDRIQKVLLADDTYVQRTDLTTADADVAAVILYIAALDRPEVKAQLLDSAIRKYPQSVFLQALQVAAGGAAGVGKETERASAQCVVTENSVNVRSAPDESKGRVIDRLNKGAKVEVTEKTVYSYAVAGRVGAWFHLKSPDGWVFGPFLESSGNVNAGFPIKPAPAEQTARIATTDVAQQPASSTAAMVAPDRRVLTALTRIDLHLLADYGFAAGSWPALGAVQWPALPDCFPSSDVKNAWAAMEAALNARDLPSAMRAAEDAAAAAAGAGLTVSAVDIAQVVKAYAEQTGETYTTKRMDALIESVKDRLGVSPEFSAAEVSKSALSLKPGTLFVGTVEGVSALGLSEIDKRFANMMEILAEEMAGPVDLTSCRNLHTPGHKIRDFWIMAQRLRIQVAALEDLIQKGRLEPVVQTVPRFNGEWMMTRDYALGGCMAAGLSPTWK